MKFTLVICGILGCYNSAFFEKLSDCQAIADRLQSQNKEISIICVERSPSFMERLFK